MSFFDNLIFYWNLFYVYITPYSKVVQFLIFILIIFTIQQGIVLVISVFNNKKSVIEGKRNNIRLIVLFLTVAISLYIFYFIFLIDKNNFEIIGTTYLFKHELLNFNICYDGISILFWILTSILIVLCVLVNWIWNIRLKNIYLLFYLFYFY